MKRLILILTVLCLAGTSRAVGGNLTLTPNFVLFAELGYTRANYDQKSAPETCSSCLRTT